MSLFQESAVPVRRYALAAVLAVCAGVVAPGGVRAQAPTGPIRPPEEREVVRIPTRPVPSQPPIPAEELIRQFAAHEDELARVLLGYTYRRTVRLDEFGPDGRPAGRAELVGEIVVDADGQRRQRTSGRLDSSTLEVLDLAPDALEWLAGVPSFPFGTAQLSNYEITYLAAEPLDELNTYVFRVTPRQLERGRAFFSGVIWVDDRDLTIVKTYGRWVSETGDMHPPELPFTVYETFRQPVADRYWMPAYAVSDASATGPGGASVRVRLVIRWENYKSIGSGRTSAPAQPPQETPR